MHPIELEIYLQAVGGIGILGLTTHLITVFNLKIKVIEIKSKLIKKQIPIKTNEERLLNKVDKINVYIKSLLYGFAAAIIASLVYGIGSSIEYISNSNTYIISVSIISYLTFVLIPLFIGFNIYKIFEIYSKIRTMEQEYLSNEK